MRWIVVSVGRNAEPFVREACEAYAARIRRYAELVLTVVPPERVAAEGNRGYILRQEARRIREKIPPAALRVLLDEKAPNPTSTEFARLMEKWTSTGTRDVVFLIGGAYGLDEGLRREADARLSLSSMTLTYGMARMILLEQIYRAFTLIRKMPYHK